jgi:hypothetical protein
MVANNSSMANSMLMGLQQQQSVQQGMAALHHSFSGRPTNSMGRQMMQNQIQNSVPFTIESDGGMNDNFQQLQPDAGFDSPVHPNQAFSFHEVNNPGANLDPVPFNEVFPDDRSSGNDLGNYLSNLDLSNT